MLKYLIYFNALIILATSSSEVKHPCRDENNQPVDWYVIYKLPKIEDHENELVAQGTAYAYITSKDNHGWILSKKAITEVDSIPGLTLAPVYEPRQGKSGKPGKPDKPDKPGKPAKPGKKSGKPGNPDKPGKPGKPGNKSGKAGNPGEPEKTEKHRSGWPVKAGKLRKYKNTKGKLFYMLYNDQVPDTKDYYGDGGHAKGAVVGGDDGGFWLVHSVPRYAAYPDESQEHGYPGNGFWNGQSFLCITMDTKNLEKAGKGLFYNQLHVYATNVPNSLKHKYPELFKVANDKHAEKPGPWNKMVDIVSAGGKKFKVFSKAMEYDKELYTDWVAPELGVDLMVQTWPNGKKHQPSSCDIHSNKKKVENILSFKVKDIEFDTKIDHSKWAASESKNEPWVCVGDINKDDSQYHRGGGTVCLKDEKLWEAYHGSAADLAKC